MYEEETAIYGRCNFANTN